MSMRTAAAVAIGAFLTLAGAARAHEGIEFPGGGPPGTHAVIVDIGPAPGHVLQVRIAGEAPERTTLDGLAQAVRERLAESDDTRPWIRGHCRARYDAVYTVMAALKAAGMTPAVFIERAIWERAHGRPAPPGDCH